ncbi:MAG: hypothetical protein ICV87_03685, partial [Gemmatimonadetes bacterium]|nr:hypothetical protein [Gemmatimonadota bacterium]
MKRLLPLLFLALAAACDDPSGSKERLEVGDVLTLNVNADSVCSAPVNRQAKVVALSQHAAVLADINNPANGFTDSEYQQFADEFDRVAWPVVTTNFGTPSDVDDNGRVLMLFTSAVNELTPRGANYIVGGFFYGRDLFPRKANDRAGACASSNEREMFYLLAPDPSGSINGNARSKTYVRNSTFGTLAHEFQHLVNASRRLYTNGADDFEVTWLDEGLAHIAEELAFYQASGLTPRRNIATTTAFFPTNDSREALERYQSPNLGRLYEYYQDPDGNSPIQGTPTQPDDDVATRGAAWQFLRYAADQKGGNERDLWFALANSKTTGIANVTAVFGGDPLATFQNWGVAIYTDDTVPGVAPAYTHPSWNFRQIFSNGITFPLEVVALTSGVNRRIDLAATGNAYLRAGVAPGVRAEVRTSGVGLPGAGACTAAPLTAVGQVYQPAPAAASSICLDGGATGAEYTIIPFFASTTNNERAVVNVTATGVVPPTGTFSAALSASGPTLSRAAAEADGGFEA